MPGKKGTELCIITMCCSFCSIYSDYPYRNPPKLGWELHKLRVRKNGCLCVKRARNKLEREKERCFPAKMQYHEGSKDEKKKRSELFRKTGGNVLCSGTNIDCRA